MLDPRFKSLIWVSYFIGREQGIAIIEEYVLEILSSFASNG
jgi:hypothetical protein